METRRAIEEQASPLEEQAPPTASARLGTLGRRYLPGIGGIAAVTVGCIAWAVIAHGSVYHAWLYARGTRVTIEPAAVTVPDGKVGEAREAVFLLRNLSSSPVRVIGATKTCTCTWTTDKLPITVPSHGTQELHVTLHLVKSPIGRTEQNVVFHTDHLTAPSLTVTVKGRVIDP